MAYEAEAGDISIALVGDSMINRRLTGFREPEYLAMVELLQSADLSLTNLETQINEFEPSWAQKPNSVSWQVGPESSLDDLKWMGFSAMNVANNHSYDYSEQGFQTTLRHLHERGIATFGGGSNLDEARAPALLDLPNGRVAVMGGSTTFSDQSQAGAARPDFPGKPGINALHHERVHHVPKEALDALRAAKEGLGYKEYDLAHRAFHPHRYGTYDDTTEVSLLGETFRLADDYDITTSFSAEDMAGIEGWIRSARETADWLIYSVHCHESGRTGEIFEVHRESPPDFLVEFAHWTIDQGCSLFVGHGPHILRGIEIYQGKPILYSLGNFIFHNETVQRQPEPAYRRQQLDYTSTPGDWSAARSGHGAYGFPATPVFFRSVVAVCNYSGGELEEVRLHPIELGFGQPTSQRGRPTLATPEVGAEILAWLQRVSEPFGTRIDVEDGVGVIRV